MKIVYLTYSLPFKWWNRDNNIAHNKIWAYLVMNYFKMGHQQTIWNSIDLGTQMSLREFNCNPRNHGDAPSKYDIAFLFCGPFMPIADGSITMETLEFLRKFQGKVVYITVDYNLEFDPRMSRYGKLFKSWDSDALTKGKKWTYVMNAPVEYHFRTPGQRKLLDSFVSKDRQISVPLNSSGIPPNWKKFTPSKTFQYDLLYCGAFRSDRKVFFDKYFCSKYASKWTISTSTKNIQKFREMGCKARMISALGGEIVSHINRSVVQIIAGDTCDNNTSTTPLPTRYYEAVSAKTPAFFDKTFCKGWKSETEEVCLQFLNTAEDLAEMIEYLKKPSVREDYVDMQEAVLHAFDPVKDWKLQDLLR